MDKPIKLNQLIAYRVHKVGYTQDTQSLCVACGRSFQTCNHSFGQVLEAITNVRVGIALGIFNAQKPVK